jgi:bacillolysin
VTEHSSGLLYYYEAGAINEALSDIFGEYFDLLNGTNSTGTAVDGVALGSDPNAWLMGEDLGIGAIRNMANPPAMGDPDRMRSANYYAPGGIAFNGDAGDSGGVHTNSGVANKAAYLMVVGGSFNGQTITPLGATLKDSIILAGNIWYDVEYLLTSGSDYNVLNEALQTACNGLVGLPLTGTTETLTSADCVEVQEVALATEMHLEPSATGYSPATTVGCTDSTDTVTNLFFADFEGATTGMTYQTTSTGATATNWGPTTGYARGGVQSLWAQDTVSTDSSARLTSDVSLAGGAEYFLYFDHAYGFEDNLLGGDTKAWDGGVLEYRTNGGAWTDASALFHSGRNYNGTGYASSGTALANRSAFVYDSHGYVSSRYNLTSKAGMTINFRWRIITDTSVTDLGWLLDNVRIYKCVDGAGGPTATPTSIPPTATNTPIPPTTAPTSTPAPALPAPTLISPAAGSTTNDRTPTFTWSPVSGAAAYRIQVVRVSTGAVVVNQVVTGTSYTPPTNLARTNFYWRVQTQNSSGVWGSYSANVNFTIK